jgi:hypothetical protein
LKKLTKIIAKIIANLIPQKVKITDPSLNELVGGVTRRAIILALMEGKTI